MTSSSEKPTSGEDSDSGFSVNTLVRTEAIALLLIVVALISVYVYFFLDEHLEWALEEGLTRSNGAQVDVADLKTSFLQPSLTIRGIRATNPRRPTHNLIELGQLSVGLSWSGLVRSKLIFEDIQVRQLAYGTERPRPGRVLAQGGALKGLFDALYGLAAAQVKQQSRGTLFENVISLMEGTDLKQQLENMKDELESYRKVQEISSRVEELRGTWQQRLDELPGKQELDRIKQELESIKQSKSDPAQMVGKLREIQTIVDRLKDIRKKITRYQQSFSQDLEGLQGRIGELQTAVQQDRETLRRRFQLPSLDLENFSRQLFQSFLDQQTRSLTGLIERARQYVPARGGPVKQPEGRRPRAEGVNYMFRTTDSLPSWWVKKALLDATVPEVLGGGQIGMKLRDFSSNPPAVDQPALLTMNGQLPGAPVKQLEGMLKMDHRTANPTEQFRIHLQELSIQDWSILDSPRYRFVIEQAIGAIKTEGTVQGSSLEATLDAVFDRPAFQVESRIGWLKSVLDSAVRSLEKITLNGRARGALDQLRWTVQSNLGGALSRSLQNQVKQQIEGAQQRLVSRFNSQIGERTGSLKGNQSDLKSLVSGQLGGTDSRVKELLGLASNKTGRFENRLNEKSGPLKDKQKELMESLGDKLKF